jgi:hypothetical protein
MLKLRFIISVLAWIACSASAFSSAPEPMVPGKIGQMERAASVVHGRPIVCLLGYINCQVALNVLLEKELPPEAAPFIALVPPYETKSTAEDVGVLTFDEVLSLKAGAPNGVIGMRSPDWAVLTPADQALYQKIWKDGELRISHFMGHRDHGVGGNPDRFTYGSYALELDKLRYFASQWGLEVRRIDEIETELTGTIAPDRRIRIRVIDANVFCPDEQELIDAIEQNSIERDPRGYIRAIKGNDTFQRNLDCAKQDEASAAAKRRLFGTLSNPDEDMVFYQGHSRFGNGPDFGPFSKTVGKVNPPELIRAIVSSKVSVVYFNGCSGGKNYGTLIEQATETGKTVVWNEKAPNRLDGVDNLLLFTQGIIERRPLKAVERYMNLTQERGQWPNTVHVSLARQLTN